MQRTEKIAMTLVSDAAWQQRVAALPVESFAIGAAVFAEGTKTGRLLVLKSGAVGISKNGTEIARVAEAGAVFGELSALLDLPHTADVHALEPSEFYVANAAQLLDDPAALLFVTTVLARRVVGANAALLELKQQIEAGAPPGVLEAAADRIVGLLSAIGSGYIRAGAGLTGYPFQ
jgi:CRP/FNR family cyclic AMP-dependent transcriptional regulator